MELVAEVNDVTKQHDVAVVLGKMNDSDLLQAEFNNGNDAYKIERQRLDLILYPQRWFVLLSFAILSCSSAWMWITWSPISTLMADHWNVSVAAVDALSGVYMYIYVFGSFISLYFVVNYGGLRGGLSVGAFMNVMGAIVRYLGRNNYRTVYFGTLLAAIAQTFTLSTPPLISAKWFGDNERATATSLGVLANQMGTALGLGATLVWSFDSDGDNFDDMGSLNDEVLQWYLRLQMIVTAIALFMVLIGVQNEPPSPPNLGADLLLSKTTIVEKKANETSPLMIKREGDLADVLFTDYHSMTYVESVVHLFSHIRLCSFLCCFALPIGIFYTLPTFLSQWLPPWWSSRAVGAIGLAYQGFGVLGSFGAGLWTDSTTNKHRMISLTLLSASVLCLALYAYSVHRISQHQGMLSNERLVIDAITVIAIVGSGIGLAGWNAVGLEFAASLTFPADEAAIAGILESASELTGFIFVTISAWTMEYFNDTTVVVSCAAFVVTAALVLLLCTPTPSSRPSAML